MVQSSATGTALRIGSRGSPLALAQAHEVRDRLAAVHGFEAAAIEVCAIRTSGDRIQDRTLADIGGKGLFTKEIEEALRDGAIDLAVHSAKDMPTILPDGLALAAFLRREDARDAFISRIAGTLGELAAGSVVGTASLRRQALIKRLRPDLAVTPLRGNVDTRLRKLDEGVVDATLLALAGLKRLGRAAAATAVMSLDDFPPAVGQGAIAIEVRADDTRAHTLLAAIDDEDVPRHDPQARWQRSPRGETSRLPGGSGSARCRRGARAQGSGAGQFLCPRLKRFACGFSSPERRRTRCGPRRRCARAAMTCSRRRSCASRPTPTRCSAPVHGGRC